MISFILLSTSYHPLFPLALPSSCSPSTPSPVTPLATNISLPLEYLAQPHLPDPSRGWVDLNAGFLLDPVWTGFKHRSDVLVLERREVAENLRIEHEQEERRRCEGRNREEKRLAARSTSRKLADWVQSAFTSSRPPVALASPSTPLQSVHSRQSGEKRWDPERKRLDLRWNGVGCVLDFGFGRGESEVRERLRDEARRAFSHLGGD